MKIAVLTHTIPRFLGDPSAPFMDILSTAISKEDQKVMVIAPFDEKIDKKFKRQYKFTTYKYIYPDSLHTLGYSRTLKGDKSMTVTGYLVSPFLYLFGFLKLLKIVKEKKIDVVCSHWIIPNGFIAAIVSKITKVPFTITIPGSDIYLAGKNPLFKLMAGFAASNASYVISDSSHYLKQLNDLGYFPKKTAVIRYGVDTQKFKPTNKSEELLRNLGISKNNLVVLAVGRIVPKKGFIYLIKSIPEIIKKNHNIKFVIVGDGDQRKLLEDEVKKSGTEKNVIFAGTISYNELSKYYNLADVFVMPSIRDEKGNIDASPVSMMEAMACGAKVIATKFSGSEDLIINGKTGFLVKEKNSREIADSVIKLLSKKSSNNFRSEVRRIAVKNFSSRSIAKRYIQIFKNITN